MVSCSSQSIISKKAARLNHLAFNPNHPLVVVGDSAGNVHSVKLSPNLRRQSKEMKLALLNKDTKTAGELEVKKLEILLAQVRIHHIPQE